MAAVAPHPQQRESRPARQRQPRGAARPQPGASQRRLAGGVAWIVVVAALLAGVVALNVAVLRLNLRFDDLGQKRAKVRAENAALSSKLASAAATQRIQQLAGRELGVAPASPAQTTYVPLGR